MTELRDSMDHHLFILGTTEVTVGLAVATVLVASITLVLAWMAKRLTVRHFERHGVKNDLSAKTAATLVATFVVIVGLDVVLHIFGIGLTSLIAAGGVFALAAGFAAKDIVANFLAGIILRLDRTISPGDLIQMEDRWLRIEKIGVRSTVGNTVEDEQILIPNSKLSQSTVTNLTRENNLFLVQVTVPVSLTSDAELVERVLGETVASLDWVSSQEARGVYLSDINRYSIEFVVAVWIDDPTAAFESRSKLNKALWSALHEAGVQFG
jgi:small-conductance mechanosensitive channel